MNSRQIEILLSKNTFSKNNFIGVYASDKIPKNIKKYPSSFVANTDSSEQTGEHWVAFWISDKKNAEYFCSLGKEPNQNINIFLQKFKKVKINRKQIQADSSDTCGHYYVHFIVCRAYRMSFEEIIETLWKTRAMADMLVKFFVRHLIMS